MGRKKTANFLSFFYKWTASLEVTIFPLSRASAQCMWRNDLAKPTNPEISSVVLDHVAEYGGT